MMHGFFYALLMVTGVAVLARFTMLAIRSQRGEPPALIDGALKACPATPNCVCSETSSVNGAIAPLVYEGDAAQAWRRLVTSVTSAGGAIRNDTGGYLWATFKTPLFRYVDDVEARLDREMSVIHLRSASRVGYSDFGANRKRVELIRRLFATPVDGPG